MKFLTLFMGLTLVETIMMGVYPINLNQKQHILVSNHSNIRLPKFAVINKTAFGLHIPYVKEYIFIWNPPKHGDKILVKTKSGEKILKEVVFVSKDVFIKNEKRHIVPENYIGVKNWEAKNGGDIPSNEIYFLNNHQVIGKILKLF